MSLFLKGILLSLRHSVKFSSIPLDQALEMQYNKPAKSQSGIVGITRKKEAVNKWNILRHEKLQYTQFLEQMCNMSSNDEYSLHHEFSPSITENDCEAVLNIIDYINEHVNLIRIDENTLVNLATGVKFDTCSSEFLINCLQIGDENYQNFKISRLVNKTEKLFDPIHKVHSKQSHKAVSKSEAIKKETVTFMKYVDFARVRKYDFKLLKYDIISTPFYLTKEQYLRKSSKSELAQEIKKLLPERCPEAVPVSNIKAMFILEFTGHCREVPIKSLKMKTYEDLFTRLWGMFKYVSKNSLRIDVIFDERDRKSSDQAIGVKIVNACQKLPIEMENFWSSSSNKIQLQQMFINTFISTSNFPIPGYLGKWFVFI